MGVVGLESVGVGPAEQGEQGGQIGQAIGLGGVAEGGHRLDGLLEVQLQLGEHRHSDHEAVGLEHADPVGVALGASGGGCHQPLAGQR